MIWLKKQETVLEDNSKKFVLERTGVFGGQRRIKFIERPFPPKANSTATNVISITRRRHGWRFRMTYPIITLYYKRNTKGAWVQIGSVFP